MSEAAEPNPEAYATFNDFFTRELKPGIRPLADGEKTLVSPVDGAISQLGQVTGDRVFQAWMAIEMAEQKPAARQEMEAALAEMKTALT